MPSEYRTMTSPAPGFGSLVEHRQVLTPLDMERRYGITGGNIFHGEMICAAPARTQAAASWARRVTTARGRC